MRCDSKLKKLSCNSQSKNETGVKNLSVEVRTAHFAARFRRAMLKDYHLG